MCRRYGLRRTAFRILSSSPALIISKPRSIATLPPSVLRISRQSSLFQTQRRLASDDVTAAEPEAEGATPAATSSHSIAQSSNRRHSTTTDNDLPASADQEDSSTIAAALASVNHTVSNRAADAAKAIAGSAESAKHAVADAAASAGLRFAAKGREEGGRRIVDGTDRSSAGPRTATPSSTLYVGNLYFDVTEEDLRREMERFGTVMSVKIIYDGRGLSKG